MKALFRTWKVALPMLITLAFWQWGKWAFTHFHCSYYANTIPPCIAHGYNIQGLLGLSLFWAQLAFYLLLLMWIAALVVTVSRPSRHGS